MFELKGIKQKNERPMFNLHGDLKYESFEEKIWNKKEYRVSNFINKFLTIYLYGK